MKLRTFAAPWLLAAAMLVAGLPAAADDAGTIAACLKAEHDGGRDGSTCIGRVSDPCMERPGGETTMGMVQCADAETKVWDDLLNAEYKRLLGVIESKAGTAVRNAQRAWIATRDADCTVPYDIFAGGTMAQPIAATCILDHTARRFMLVRDWREMAAPQ